MAERVDFSKNAGVYDGRHGAVRPSDVARRLAMSASVGTHRRCSMSGQEPDVWRSRSPRLGATSWRSMLVGVRHATMPDVWRWLLWQDSVNIAAHGERRKAIAHIATSADGEIARSDGALQWSTVVTGSVTVWGIQCDT